MFGGLVDAADSPSGIVYPFLGRPPSDKSVRGCFDPVRDMIIPRRYDIIIFELLVDAVNVSFYVLVSVSNPFCFANQSISCGVRVFEGSLGVPRATGDWGKGNGQFDLASA